MEEKEFDYMNVIPLVDVMLVLLTIVLTTSTFIATGVIPVQLPKASKGQEQTLKTATIEINKQGDIFFNAQKVGVDGLKETIALLDRETPIIIRADRDIALQIFVDVLDVVKNMEFKKVSLQIEREVPKKS